MNFKSILIIFSVILGIGQACWAMEKENKKRTYDELIAEYNQLNDQNQSEILEEVDENLSKAAKLNTDLQESIDLSSTSIFVLPMPVIPEAVDIDSDSIAPNRSTHQSKPNNKKKELNCPYCNVQTVFGQKELAKHITDEHEGNPTYPCFICFAASKDGKVIGFKSKNGLHQHKKNHEKIRYQCTQCDFIHKEIPNAIDHAKAEHPEIEDYESIIKKIIPTESETTIPEVTVAPEDNPKYICSICLAAGIKKTNGKVMGFKSRNDLYQHKQKNHKKIRYQCTQCASLKINKIYIKQKHATNHAKSKHPEIESYTSIIKTITPTEAE